MHDTQAQTAAGSTRSAINNGESTDRLPHARTIELRGHIIDSHILSQVMDLVMDREAEFYIEQFDIGRHKYDPSYARIALHADTAEALDELVGAVLSFGGQVVESEERDARTV